METLKTILAVIGGVALFVVLASAGRGADVRGAIERVRRALGDDDKRTREREAAEDRVDELRDEARERERERAELERRTDEQDRRTGQAIEGSRQFIRRVADRDKTPPSLDDSD